MNVINRQNRDMTGLVKNAHLQYAREQIKQAIRAVKKLVGDNETDDNIRNMMLDMGRMCDELENRSTRLREGCEGGICANSGGVINTGKTA